MIYLTYRPRPQLVFKRTNNEIACTLETRPGINLSASKTILVINQDGDPKADDDVFSLDLALLYQTSKL